MAAVWIAIEASRVRTSRFPGGVPRARGEDG
jgi:hypothetical protein